MAAVAFPRVKATSRSYNPGSYPQTVFEAQNGATTVVRFGNRRVNAELDVSFANITDAEAALILKNYEAVNADWDWVTFTPQDATVGADNSLQSYLQETGGSALRWRYTEPPSVQSIFPGISTVSCRFRAFLDG